MWFDTHAVERTFVIWGQNILRFIFVKKLMNNCDSQACKILHRKKHIWALEVIVYSKKMTLILDLHSMSIQKWYTNDLIVDIELASLQSICSPSIILHRIHTLKYKKWLLVQMWCKPFSNVLHSINRMFCDSELSLVLQIYRIGLI